MRATSPPMIDSSTTGVTSTVFPVIAESRDATAEKAAELGGREYHRMEMPQGGIAILSDPQGAPFGVWAGETDD